MRQKRAKATKELTLNGVFDVKSVKQRKGADVVKVAGFANFAAPDRVKELIDPDAWDLENYLKNPVIMVNHGHDPHFGELPVGKATKIKPTEKGLFVEAEVLEIPEHEATRRLVALIKNGMIRAFSVGFRPIDEDVNEDGIKVIKSAELFENSIVGVPMQQDSIFEVTGKMLKTKTTEQISADICRAKGAWVAGAVHNRIFQLMRDEQLDRDATLQQIAEQADIDMDELTQIIAGNVTPVPESVLEAFSENLSIELEALRELDAGDVEVEGSSEDEVEDDAENEPQDEASDSSEEPEGEEESSEEEEERTAIEDDSSDEDEDDDERAVHTDKDDDEKRKGELRKPKQGDDFQSCVSAKIPKFLEEGMEQDQAVAAAINFCQRAGKCAGLAENGKPTNEQYRAFFQVVDSWESGKKSTVTTNNSGTGTDENDSEKQADQDGVSQVSTEVPAGNTAVEDSENGDPNRELLKQILLAQTEIVSELRKQTAILTKSAISDEPVEDSEDETQENNSESDTSDEKRFSHKQALVPERSATNEEKRRKQGERSERFGIEAMEGKSENLTFQDGQPLELELYGDPVNLKFPMADVAQANNARSMFAKEADNLYDATKSKRVVHNRIVRRQLALGAKPSFDPSDSLDKLLDTDLKARLRELLNEAELEKGSALLDSFNKRVENFNKRLKELGVYNQVS